MTPKSTVLLGGSCVAFIAFVGCLFELTSGQPDLGNLATVTILTASLPLGVYLFYAAIRDANASR